MGVVPPETGFLKGLHEIANKNGALLIVDEVITGFRLHNGSAQELLGVEADLTTLGKIIGGGVPVAAYGGRAELMDRSEEHTSELQSQSNLVCRLLLEKKKHKTTHIETQQYN